MSRFNQSMKGFITAETRLDMKIVGHIIAVMGGRDKGGTEPDNCDAQVNDVIQFITHAPERTATKTHEIVGLQPIMTITGIKAIHKKMINHCLPSPGRRG